MQNRVKGISETRFLLKDLLNKVDLTSIFPSFRDSTDKRQRLGLTQGVEWSLGENS